MADLQSDCGDKVVDVRSRAVEQAIKSRLRIQLVIMVCHACNKKRGWISKRISVVAKWPREQLTLKFAISCGRKRIS